MAVVPDPTKDVQPQDGHPPAHKPVVGTSRLSAVAL